MEPYLQLNKSRMISLKKTCTNKISLSEHFMIVFDQLI